MAEVAINPKAVENRIIVESGTTTGSYQGTTRTIGYRAIKFSDGTMIESVKTSVTMNISTAWGSLYSCSSSSTTTSVTYLGEFPVPFTNIPIVTASQTGSYGAMIGRITNFSETSMGNIYVSRGTSRDSTPVEIHIIAIGKWK